MLSFLSIFLITLFFPYLPHYSVFSLSSSFLPLFSVTFLSSYIPPFLLSIPPSSLFLSSVYLFLYISSNSPLSSCFFSHHPYLYFIFLLYFRFIYFYLIHFFSVYSSSIYFISVYFFSVYLFSACFFSQVGAVDFEYAKILRSTIKLVGTASLNKDGSLAVFVSPMMVPLGTALSSAKGPGNM